MKHVGMATVFGLLLSIAPAHGSSVTPLSAQSTPTTLRDNYESLIINSDADIRAALKELPAGIVDEFIDNRDEAVVLRTVADVWNALEAFAEAHNYVLVHHYNAATRLV